MAESVFICIGPLSWKVKAVRCNEFMGTQTLCDVILPSTCVPNSLPFEVPFPLGRCLQRELTKDAGSEAAVFVLGHGLSLAWKYRCCLAFKYTNVSLPCSPYLPCLPLLPTLHSDTMAVSHCYLSWRVCLSHRRYTHLL